MTKLIISTLAATITLITASTAGAQTRHRQELVNRPAVDVTIPVSGAEWWQDRGARRWWAFPIVEDKP